MKATELRIGNWVSMRTESSVHVDGNDFLVSHRFKEVEINSISVEGVNYNGGWIIFNEIYGIPISAGWLERLEFDEKKVAGMDAEYFECFLNNENIGIEFGWDNKTKLVDIATESGEPSTNLPHIKYVHQLQNIYFALTGTELEIKQLA